MADEQHGASLLGHVAHFAEALLLEFRVADGQHFVHYEDFRFEVRRDRERQPQVHARGVAFDGRVNILGYFGEIHDLIEFGVNLSALHAEDGAVHVDIFASRQFGMETRPHFE